MGYLLPTLLAFGLNSFGVNIFHETSKAGCEPLVSSLIFLFGVFLLLWDLRLFPSGLRSLVKLAALIMHFFIAAFCMENIMNNFWFPLESSLFALLPKVADLESHFLRAFGWKSGGLLSFLRTDAAKVLASYSLALFFLVTVLHATRVIDLRLLRCGKDIFMEDVLYRFRKVMRKLYKKFTKKKVKFQGDNCECDFGYRRRDRKEC